MLIGARDAGSSSATPSRVEPVAPLELKGKSSPSTRSGCSRSTAGAESRADLDAPLVGRERSASGSSGVRATRSPSARASCSRCSARPASASRGSSRDFLEPSATRATSSAAAASTTARASRTGRSSRSCSRSVSTRTTCSAQLAAETQLAFRGCSGARRRAAAVVVFDDIQWAEPTFLELVEHVADSRAARRSSSSASRAPELLDARPGWGGGKLNATTLLLEPLAEEECDRLIDAARGGRVDDESGSADPRAAGRATRSSSRRCSRWRASSGDGEIVVPPTIQALLQARLDPLGRRRAHRDRARCRRGQGVPPRRGRRARADAVAQDVEAHLVALVRKELIRPTAADLRRG